MEKNMMARNIGLLRTSGGKIGELTGILSLLGGKNGAEYIHMRQLHS